MPGEDRIGFLPRNLTHKNIAPANFTSVPLQLSWSFWPERILAIPVIRHSCVVHHELIIENHGGAVGNLRSPEVVPFAKRFVGEDSRVLSRSTGAIVPKSAGAFVRAHVPFAAFFGPIPDLHLGIGPQIDPAVRLRNGLVIN